MDLVSFVILLIESVMISGKEEEEMKAEHETKKSRKMSLKICKPFSLSFFVSVLKSYFAEKQF